MEQGKTIKEIGKALGVSFLVTIFFLLLLAIVMLKSGLSEEIVSKIMIAGYLLAPAAGGFLLGKKQKVNRFLWGLLVGVIYFFIYFAIAVCTMEVPVTDLFWVAVPICLGGMAGGMLS
ncbi:MAG: TIGR04086 family membrane protein [Lachnospiraceae bacterium]|nr:TIGR04086 family membrane protein [Lachnospiraceae bacterium]